MSAPAERQDVLLFGQLETPLAPADLAAALCGVGLSAEARESSLYWGGIYVRLYVDDEVDFTLERIEAARYMARADADPGDACPSEARKVSAALARLAIRHSFEIYDGSHRLLLYLHYEWPENDWPAEKGEER